MLQGVFSTSNTYIARSVSSRVCTRNAGESARIGRIGCRKYSLQHPALPAWVFTPGALAHRPTRLTELDSLACDRPTSASDLRSPSITGSDLNLHSSTCGTLRASSQAYRSLHFATDLPSQQLRSRHHGDIHSRPFASNGAHQKVGVRPEFHITCQKVDFRSRSDAVSITGGHLDHDAGTVFDLCRFRLPQGLTSTCKLQISYIAPPRHANRRV